MSQYSGAVEKRTDPNLVIELSPSSTIKYTIPLVPLTVDAFRPFGSVIQAYPDGTAVPNGIRVTQANSGTATKFHKLALLTSSYPKVNDADADIDTGSGTNTGSNTGTGTGANTTDSNTVATTGISIFVCSHPDPSPVSEDGKTINVNVLERHRYTTQSFTPIMVDPLVFGYTSSNEARYVVLVAENGEDGIPALDTLKGFIATGSQSINYKTAVWHHPMLVLDKTMAFQCVETQIGDGSISDCEIITYTENIIELTLPEKKECNDVDVSLAEMDNLVKEEEGELSHQVASSSVVIANGVDL